MQKIYKHFTNKTRKLINFILRLFTQKRVKVNKKKERVRAIKRAKRRAAELEYRLQNLGFTERALADLQNIIYNKKKLYQKRPAARVLANWYANQHKEEEARKCLEVLSVAVNGEKNQKSLNEAAIMKAECHDLLGNFAAGKSVINKALDSGSDPALYLMAANFEDSIPDRLKWINRALALYNISAISYNPFSGPTAFDCLGFGNPPPQNNGQATESNPKITVIITVYNSEATIEMALNSILNQTWTNLEVLVVDDCSTDGTIEVIEDCCHEDIRVQLIKAVKNYGTFVARNLALKEATGLLITCHDADDWSHPQRIERQAVHLMLNPDIIGNMSQQIRLTSDFKIHRRGKYGKIILENTSSFMFRREPVMKIIGYWDSVRSYADNEYIRRIRKEFGVNSVVNLPTGPLALVRQHSSSLTGHKYFGKHGFIMGINKHYRECQMNYHEKADTLYYEFPQRTRPFPVPEPMWPQREVMDSRRRHFDIILASDFRLTGETNYSNVEEIKAQKQMGLQTGLVQLSCYDQSSNLTINTEILDLLDGDQVQMIVYGERVKCDCLIIRHPQVLQERQLFIPDVDANSINVIINCTPKTDYGQSGCTIYEIERCNIILQEYFGKDGTWHPTSPLVRETITRHHAEELSSVALAGKDWVEIIDVDKWKRPARPTPGRRIRIGRISRDHFLRWPASREDLHTIYPNSENFEVHILGGAETPKKILGYLPINWHVLPFDKKSIKEFLAELDIFVYYTHPEMIDSYDRVIIEAMAVGVPVIIPAPLSKYYSDAAVYADISEVRSAITRLMVNDDYYQLMVDKAQQYVENNFGYIKHFHRVRSLTTFINNLE